MRRRTIIVAGLVGVLAVVLTVGIAVAAGRGGADLPALTPSELLTRVAEEASNTSAVSGDFVWRNDLLGGAGAALAGGDADLVSLLLGGSGSLWYEEGRIRLEIGSAGGEMIAVLNGSTAWLYDSRAGTATEFTLPAWPDHGWDSDTTTSPERRADLPRQIRDAVEMLAPYATLTVTTAVVAERDSYVLTMTPTAEKTVVGSVQASFDGATFMPLRVQVFAVDEVESILEAGFTTVSYAAPAPGTFDFTPPADVAVERTTVTLPAAMLEGMMGSAGKGVGEGPFGGESLGREPLTLEEAGARAGFALAAPVDPVLPFKGAHVLDPASAPFSKGGEGGPAAGIAAPVAILEYGEGFGSVLVIETQVDDGLWSELTTGLAQVPLFGTPSDFGGHQAYQLTTKLGSVVVWQQGDLVVVAGGSVPRADLEAFVAGIVE